MPADDDKVGFNGTKTNQILFNFDFTLESSSAGKSKIEFIMDPHKLFYYLNEVLLICTAGRS